MADLLATSFDVAEFRSELELTTTGTDHRLHLLLRRGVHDGIAAAERIEVLLHLEQAFLLGLVPGDPDVVELQGEGLQEDRIEARMEARALDAAVALPSQFVQGASAITSLTTMGRSSGAGDVPPAHQ